MAQPRSPLQMAKLLLDIGEECHKDDWPIIMDIFISTFQFFRPNHSWENIKSCCAQYYKKFKNFYEELDENSDGLGPVDLDWKFDCLILILWKFIIYMKIHVNSAGYFEIHVNSSGYFEIHVNSAGYFEIHVNSSGYHVNSSGNPVNSVGYFENHGTPRTLRT